MSTKNANYPDRCEICHIAFLIACDRGFRFKKTKSTESNSLFDQNMVVLPPLNEITE